MPTLEALLASRTTEGELYQRLENGAVRCFACGHRCFIPSGLKGICKVRYNEAGVLRVPRGYVAGLAADPIEKKPFFHVLPGSIAFSFGMLGCDLHCGYCQNWITSQALRDPAAVSSPQDVEPSEIVALARRYGAKVITSTYNEPLITSEWAVEVFRLAKAEGFLCSYVSNGNGTSEVLDYLEPWIDLYKVDLKGFDPKHYRELGGQLEPVLETIRDLKRRGIWTEIVTLIVPGFNDSDDELRRAADFIAGVDVQLPWHVTAFHDDYRMNSGATTATTLKRAYAIGREAGLDFVYPGNIPGAFGDLESTRCPSCDQLLIDRIGFRVRANRLEDGRCPACKTSIPGIWTPAPGR